MTDESLRLLSNESLRIVVADDDSVILNFYQVTLKRMGHEVVAATQDGKELVAACKRYEPDLVITDLDMPENDGIWSAEMLDERSHIPVIVISAHHEPDMVMLTSADNIHAYLVKPVKPEDLKMAIALSMRKAAEQSLN